MAPANQVLSSPAERYLTAWHSPSPMRRASSLKCATTLGKRATERPALLVATDRTILDVACGAVGLLALLQREAAPRSLFGIDLCEPELSWAAAAVPGALLTVS